MITKRYNGKHYKVFIDAKTEELKVCIPNKATLETANLWIEKCCIIKHLLSEVIIINNLLGIGRSLECDSLRLTAEVEVNYEKVIKAIYIVDFEELKLYKGEE